jgi:hypothetical protein
MADNLQIRTFARQTGLRVSDDAGVKRLHDVSLITEGDAIGHNVRIDSTTLDTVAEALKGKKLRGYITHEGALYSDRLTREVGIFSGIHRDGDKVKAATFKPLKSFATHNPAQYDALFELAEEMPTEWGISIVPEGFAVWTMEDGSEVPYRYGDDKPQGAVGEKPALRVTAVQSADFVDAPAANVGGLFRADQPNDHKETNMAENEATKEALALSKQVNDLTTKVEQLTAQLTAKENELKNAAEAHLAALAAERSRSKEILELGDKHNRREMAIAALSKGTEVSDFRAELLDAYAAGNAPQTPEPATTLDANVEPKNRDEALAVFSQLKLSNPVKASEYLSKHAAKFNK